MAIKSVKQPRAGDVQTPGMVLDEVLLAIRRANAVNAGLEAYTVHQDVFETEPDICMHLTSIISDELRKADRLASQLSDRLTAEAREAA